MKKYHFIINVVSHVLPDGEILPENTLFSYEIWADKTIDQFAYGEQLFNFWKKSNPLGNVQDKWMYGWNIVQL